MRVQVRDWRWLSPGQQVQLRAGHPVGAVKDPVTVTLAKRELSIDCRAMWRVWLEDGREAFVAPSALLTQDATDDSTSKRKKNRRGRSKSKAKRRGRSKDRSRGRSRDSSKGKSRGKSRDTKRRSKAPED